MVVFKIGGKFTASSIHKGHALKIVSGPKMGKKAPLSGKKPTTLKPDRARKLIRKFHVLLKSQAAAKAKGDTETLGQIDTEIAKLGGLKTYQLASISGQSKQRGGDSSKILVDWLPVASSSSPLSLLEVGCLQVDNACARSKRFDPHVRIDLNSQHPQILEQDFMTMECKDLFDVLSLSLVVNFVPKASDRGKMMLRAHRFLKSNGLLFFVLPRACIDNSRYFDDAIAQKLFEKCGFTVKQQRKTDKLVYWLLQKTGKPHGRLMKKLVRDRATMNNFAITIE